MLRLTLAQMRRSLPRLTAAGIAIVIGTAFVAVTLLAGNLISRSVYDRVAAPYAQADLVLDGNLDAARLDQVRDTAGVAAADPQVRGFAALTSASRTVNQIVVPTASDPHLMALTLADGAWPTGDDQVAIPPDLAQRLDATVGDDLTLSNPTWVTTGSDDDQAAEPREVTVSGIVGDPTGAFSRYGGAVVQDAAALTDMVAGSWIDGSPDTVLVALADGASTADVRASLATALPDVQIHTPTEIAQARTQSQTGGENLMFLVFVLTFAAIALFVAGLVISNTFQVLVAQRTRTLALLRAVGAGKRQVAQSVLVEAALLGVASSALGVLLGCAVAQGAVSVVAHTDLADYVPGTLAITWPVVVLPLVVGTAVTVLAALVPARMATRVAPLAALRPIDGPTLEKGSAGRVRLVVSLLMVVGGLALLVGGALAGSVGDNAGMGLLGAVTGSIVSFVGLILSAVFWLPRIASWSGRLVGLSGPTARLAAANTLRNPRRTAATSTALLIGVTLVVTMSAGAASARHTLTSQLDERYPIDVQVSVSSVDSTPPVVSPSLATAVENVDGVEAVAHPATSWLTIDGRYLADDGTLVVGPVPDGTPQDRRFSASVTGITVADATATLRDAGVYQGLAADTVVIPDYVADSGEITDGDRITVRGPSGDVTLTAVVSATNSIDSLLVTPQNLAKADANAVANTLWVALAGDGTAAVGPLRDAVADAGDLAVVSGAALDRADFEQVINIALGIVVGLLAVAVIIALIGVANTLSLSVLERRRESATLRAIGVTRGQLRWMLAVEGMLIAGVGAVLGIVLGMVYGWAGSFAGLGVMGPVEPAVPWRDIALVAVIALAAGLVASVVPGRSAVRPSPVVALAAD